MFRLTVDWPLMLTAVISLMIAYSGLVEFYTGVKMKRDNWTVAADGCLGGFFLGVGLTMLAAALGGI